VAYPVSGPATPRLLGSVPLPAGKHSSGFALVEWANAPGSEVIGMWETMTMGPIKNGSSTGTMNLYVGVVGGGAIRKLNTGTLQPTGYEGW
jgi:hypothetical protein